jgi:hypothetical protein
LFFSFLNYGEPGSGSGWHRWFGGWRRESTALVDITITIGDDQITIDVDGERAFRCELINPAVEVSIRDERGRAARPGYRRHP